MEEPTASNPKGKAKAISLLDKEASENESADGRSSNQDQLNSDKDSDGNINKDDNAATDAIVVEMDLTEKFIWDIVNLLFEPVRSL